MGSLEYLKTTTLVNIANEKSKQMKYIKPGNDSAVQSCNVNNQLLFQMWFGCPVLICMIIRIRDKDTNFLVSVEKCEGGIMFFCCKKVEKKITSYQEQ